MDQDFRQRPQRRDYTREVIASRPAPETPEKKTKKSHKRLVLAVLVIIILICSAAGGWFFIHRAKPIPENIRRATNFTIYYPSKIPAGYYLDKKSVRTSNAIVFYDLANGSQKILISEEAAPRVPLDISALQKFNSSFKEIDAPSGKAISGVDTASGFPVAIIEANATLINISGTKDVPSDVIYKLIQNMSSLPR